MLKQTYSANPYLLLFTPHGLLFTVITLTGFTTNNTVIILNDSSAKVYVFLYSCNSI